MADIVFRYEAMNSIVAQIKAIAQRYKSAATTFDSDFVASISEWEGESKEKMQSFIQGAVQKYIGETIPTLINSIAELLEQRGKCIIRKADKDRGAS